MLTVWEQHVGPRACLCKATWALVWVLMIITLRFVCACTLIMFIFQYRRIYESFASVLDSPLAMHCSDVIFADDSGLVLIKADLIREIAFLAAFLASEFLYRFWMLASRIVENGASIIGYLI